MPEEASRLELAISNLGRTLFNLEVVNSCYGILRVDCKDEFEK